MSTRQRNPSVSHELAQLADEALASALAMPYGAERNEALKKASQLRLAADRQGIQFAKKGRPRSTKR